METRFRELENESKIWLLKTHSNTSEQRGNDSCSTSPARGGGGARGRRRKRETNSERRNSSEGRGGGGVDHRKREHKTSHSSPVPQDASPNYPDHPRPRARGDSGTTMQGDTITSPLAISPLYSHSTPPSYFGFQSAPPFDRYCKVYTLSRWVIGFSLSHSVSIMTQ